MEMSPWLALGLGVLVSASGFFFAVTARKRRKGESEIFDVINQTVTLCGWLLGVGGAIISIRCVLLIIGVMSE